jgi:hypothetical protein
MYVYNDVANPNIQVPEPLTQKRLGKYLKNNVGQVGT